MEKEKHFCRKRRLYSSRVDEVNLAAKCCPKHNTVAEMGNNDNDKNSIHMRQSSENHIVDYITYQIYFWCQAFYSGRN